MENPTLFPEVAAPNNAAAFSSGCSTTLLLLLLLLLLVLVVMPGTLLALVPPFFFFFLLSCQSTLRAGGNQDIVNLNRERILQARLLHPNIVRMQNCFQDAKFVYLVLDYASGGDMYKVSLTRQETRRMECWVSPCLAWWRARFT